MTQTINLTPGPSQLYFTVADHIRCAFNEVILSLSDRSKLFEHIFKKTTDGLRQLLNIPPEYFIFFTGSATEIWERIIQNFMEECSVHLVNGSFSKRFYDVAIQLNKRPIKIEVPEGNGLHTDICVPDQAELTAITHNETSTGIALPLDTIYQLRQRTREALIAVDAVSSLSYPDFDYTQLDSVFFSVQKGFGLPAGLGVWIINDRCITKAANLVSKGISVGSYHTI